MQGTSVIRRDKNTKMKMLAAAFAVRLAQRQRDPMVMKLQKARAAYIMAKKLIMQKYGAKGMQAARLAISRK